MLLQLHWMCSCHLVIACKIRTALCSSFIAILRRVMTCACTLLKCFHFSTMIVRLPAKKAKQNVLSKCETEHVTVFNCASWSRWIIGRNTMQRIHVLVQFANLSAQLLWLLYACDSNESLWVENSFSWRYSMTKNSVFLQLQFHRFSIYLVQLAIAFQSNRHRCSNSNWHMPCPMALYINSRSE